MDLSMKIEEGFGPNALGILSIRDVPGFSSLHQNLLRLSPRLANLPEEVKKELEDPHSRYNFGWSHGKEKLESGKPAILEFKCRVPERGRSMLENFLKDHPKRTDIWSLYLDQEIRLRDVNMIRNLFERATCLSLPPKKMKFLFNKHLDYEKSLGDEERIEYVKQKAMEYVQAAMA